MADRTSKAADSSPAGNPPRSRSRGLRVFLLTFKWCRISVLLLVFVVIILGLFLNHVGLPDWAEAGLQQRLAEQGWEVKFSRLRLRWYHGIVAEDLQLNRTNSPAGPHLFLRSAEFRPNWGALFRLRLQSEGVALKEGRLIWPLPGTNAPQRTFVLNQLAGELLFQPGDHWELKYLESVCLGTHVRFRGDLTNASLVRAWRLPRAPDTTPGAAGGGWHRLLTDLERIRFTGTPSAQVIMSGDALDWRALDVSVRLTAPAVASPWGGGTNLTAVVRTVPPVFAHDPIRLALQVSVDEGRTPWADASRLELSLQLEPSLQHLLPTNAVLSARLTDARSKWGRAGKLSVDARSVPVGLQAESRQSNLEIVADDAATPWARAAHLEARVSARHGAVDHLPARIETAFVAGALETRWATSQWARVEARADLPAVPELSLFASNRLWLDRITNLPFRVSATLSNAVALGHPVDRAATTVDWQPPLADVQADVSSGEAAVSAGVRANAATREIQFTNAAALRPSSFARYLTTNAQRWIAEFDSLHTPSVGGAGRFVLPTWTHAPTNWEAEVLPTLQLSGRLEAPSASFRGVDLVAAVVPFTLTNRVWELSDLRMVRPEGLLRLNARADETTGDFRIDGMSTLNPLAFGPAVPEAEKAFAMFEITNQPPRVEAQISGNWRDAARLSATANLLLTNLSFRGVPVSGCTARITYSNEWIHVLEPVLLRPGERGAASGIGIDLRRQLLHLTNGFGRIHPMAIGQAIGPITKRTIEPYVFEIPPDARAEGTIPLGRNSHGQENMRFEVDGGRFHWNVLHFERLKGTVLWKGDLLTLTNVVGLWHGGNIDGWAHFDFEAPRGGSMIFDANIQGSSLKPIITDFQRGKSNTLDGSISGRILVDRADVNDLKSWHGNGRITLQEGLIWDIPLFGLFSPLLNAVVPGLGNSRAKEGKATFTMTNSVVHSTDLEIVANATRLQYRGWTDFDGNVDAVMEAELMREVPAIGGLISKILWPVTKLFAYQVTGTLAEPKAEPLYVIPKILTLPFLPFKAIKEIITPPKKPAETPTPAPPVTPEPAPAPVTDPKPGAASAVSPPASASGAGTNPVPASAGKPVPVPLPTPAAAPKP